MQTAGITDLDAAHCDRVKAFVIDGVAEQMPTEALEAGGSEFWSGLTTLGSELWLDTGDLEAAAGLWTRDFSALTTNNTLLNREIQKGIYDAVIGQAGELLAGLPVDHQVLEIGFILNAWHGLRLAQRFGGKVSVELSTAVADDVEASVCYGRRFKAICPDRFVVKIPLTAAGLIAARTLREEGVTINFTLGFSARQNHLIGGFTKPAYVNVFMGRCSAYVSKNDLGSGTNIGEKALLASQRNITELSRGRAERTRQIAASLRNAEQVAAIAGVDVYTMPTGVAEEATQTLAGDWRDRTAEDPAVEPTPDEARLATLWHIDDGVRELTARLDAEPPSTAEAIIDTAHACGAGDLFPRLGEAERLTIAADGKIPVYQTWAEGIGTGHLAPDTLLRLAGLAAFSKDQAALDQRIRDNLA